MKVNDSVQILPKVGQSTAQLLARLNIKTIADLINHYPKRYEDYSQISLVKDLQPSQVTVKVKLSNIKTRYGRQRGLHITEALASDDTGSIRVTWFNQPYRAKTINTKQIYYLSGKYDYSGQFLSLVNPNLELAQNLNVNTARILPVYKQTKGLTSIKLRQLMSSSREVFDQIQDDLPASIVSNYGIEPLSQSLTKLHFPSNRQELLKAKFDLGVREIFLPIVAAKLLKRDYRKIKGPPIKIDRNLLSSFGKSLDYNLTDSQRRIAWQALKDMQTAKPAMNRMIEGDVGSGKTIIAAILALNVIKQAKQVVFMAPTELLARQHYHSLRSLLSSLIGSEQISILTSSIKQSKRQTILENLASGKIKFLVGTHAVFQDKVNYHNLSLIIIDEQHRFGVEQRQKILKKSKLMPHVLLLTATPIPRTLALVLYGELDISVLAEKPPGRQPIKTELVSWSHRQQVLSTLVNQATITNQLYLVCPSIDDDSQDSLEIIYQQLQTNFPNKMIGFVHGKLNSQTKNETMSAFINQQLEILVATTVIEVGVNVTTANNIAIIAAEKFGLAQLHQLRGRVGRADQPGNCYLFLSTNDRPNRRLQAIANIDDGFKLSEIDLKLRGPGSIYGFRQSGVLDLRLADINDVRQINIANDMADEIINRPQILLKYPKLKRQIRQIQKITNLN